MGHEVIRQGIARAVVVRSGDAREAEQEMREVVVRERAMARRMNARGFGRVALSESGRAPNHERHLVFCLLYTSDAADE